MPGFGLSGGGGGGVPAQTAAQVTDHEARLNVIENLINFADNNGQVNSIKELWNAFVGFVEGDTVIDVLNLKVNKIDIADNTSTNDATKVASARVAYELELTKANRPQGTITPNDVLLVDANGDLIDSGYGLTNDNTLPDNKLALTQAVKNFLVANYQPLDEHLTSISDTTPSDKYVVIYDQTAGKYIARQGVISDIVNLQTELDKKADKIIGGTDGNVVTRDANGNIVDSGLGKTADATLVDDNLTRSQDVKGYVATRETSIRTDLGNDIATVNTNRQNQTNAVDSDLQTYKTANDLEVAKKSNKVLTPNLDEFLLSDADGDLKEGSGIKSGGAGILEVPNLTADPSTPNVGKTFLYNKNGRTYQRDDQGVISALGGNLTPSEIKDLYESNDDRNGFTDAYKQLLDRNVENILETRYIESYVGEQEIDISSDDANYYDYKIRVEDFRTNSLIGMQFVVRNTAGVIKGSSGDNSTIYDVKQWDEFITWYQSAYGAMSEAQNVSYSQPAGVVSWNSYVPRPESEGGNYGSFLEMRIRRTENKYWIVEALLGAKSNNVADASPYYTYNYSHTMVRELNVKSLILQGSNQGGFTKTGQFKGILTVTKLLKAIPKPPAPNKYIYAAQAAPKYASVGSPKYAI